MLFINQEARRAGLRGRNAWAKTGVTTEPSGVVEAIHMKGRSPPNRRLTGRSQSRKDLAAGLRTG